MTDKSSRALLEMRDITEDFSGRACRRHRYARATQKRLNQTSLLNRALASATVFFNAFTWD